jgi:hypothetical protein
MVETVSLTSNTNNAGTFIYQIEAEESAAEPPANSISATRCETIPNALTNLSSLTTCEAIAMLRPADCRSLTISHALLLAIPHACVSKTTCQPIVFDGGDFFLAF